MDVTRRDVLVASVAASVGGALAEVPLSRDALRVLAMTATPPEAWVGREHEYARDRVVEPGSDTHRIVYDLEARGLVAVVVASPDKDYDWTARATPAGIAVLRAAGVEV